MTEAPVTPERSASEVFDEALSRARATNNDPMPVLKRLELAESPGRMVADLRKMLSLRFVHAIPASEAASQHRQATQALDRLARQLRWCRARIVLLVFIQTYGWVIFGLILAGGLLAVAVLYRDAIGVFFADLLAPAPAAPPTPVAPAATSPPAQSIPTGTVP
jgi:hypothetical protein